MKQGSANVTYVHQDHLSGTSVTSDASGNLLSAISYYPFGDRWESQGTMPTDRLFTGQRLDSTGLYYYGARYYDSEIGRFISPDVVIQNPGNPQTFNRYSYVLNNPLKYVDPSGLTVQIGGADVSEIEDLTNEIQWYNDFGIDAPLDLIAQLLALLSGWGDSELDNLNEWEKLRRQEDEYTRLMMESDITFNVVGVDARSQTLRFTVDLPLIDVSEPVTLRLVSGKGDLLLMDRLSAGAITLYPVGISMRTDMTFNTIRGFTNYVAHELYHWWEQSLYGGRIGGGGDWYNRYRMEWKLEHDLRPSEIRAQKYADRYFPR